MTTETKRQLFDPVVERWQARARLALFTVLLLALVGLLLSNLITAAMQPLLSQLRLIH